MLGRHEKSGIDKKRTDIYSRAYLNTKRANMNVVNLEPFTN